MLPSKRLLFQTVSKPPKAPMEGEKTKLSMFLGEKTVSKSQINNLSTMFDVKLPKVSTH